MSEWRYIAEYPATCRLEVPGGWIYRVPSDSGAMVFVPDPYSGVVAEHEAWERGHKAGYMQAMSQQGDKVKPADEHTQYQVGYEEGWQAAASASNTVQLDKASPNYEEGYNRGFSDALNGYECEPKGDKVKPLDTDDLVAVYVPRGVTTDDMLNIVKLLYEAEAYAEGSVYAERCCAMAQKLEGK